MARGSPEEGTEPSSPAVMDEAAANRIKPRAYQQEMLAESLRQNTIVAMETGSGKTQIAVLRIQEELSRCSPEKLVWFLTPTVALAEQQYAVISKQLPIYQCRLLLGSDNVDHWSTQQIWDKILLNIRIVVSTPQVLLDAMCHGFVKLSGLSLLVFDEAHRCVKANPFNGIMRLYHHARKSGLAELPAILGLTATPATKATAEAVKLLEDNLHAICRTPAVQREELLKYTHKPELSIVTYSRNLDQTTEISRALDVILDLTLADIQNDPYVKSLRAKKDDEKSQEMLMKILDSGKTFTRKEILSLAQRARVLLEELGPWAADVFVGTCAEKFIEAAVHRSGNIFRQWEDSEKIYMMQYLSMLPPITENRVWGSSPDHISQKVESLITTIATIESTYKPGYRVIVFAEQRATVIMLAHLLSVHPLTKGVVTKYFLGNSNYANRKSNIAELSTLADQKDVLTELRVGKTNILIATNVLEEGIDVPACNVVICFDPPKDLRSFIQRRGRARDRQSRLVLFIDSNDDDGLAKWASMEQKLKEIYADNMRELEEIKALEDIEEESVEILKVASTEAVLNHQNAQPFLAHFCSTGSYAYTTNQPEYIIDRQELSPGFMQITAKVVLPSYINPSLRIAFSKSSWRTEKAAKRDAAFQAYVALYQAGMVDDNLMPIHRKKYGDPTTTPQEKQPKLIQVSECWNPWQDIAQLRRDDLALIPTRVQFDQPNPLGVPDMVLLLPTRIPCDWEFELFWNQGITLKARICNDRNTKLDFDSGQAARFTHELFLAAYQNRMISTEIDFLTLFWPAQAVQMPIEQWLSSIKGTMGLLTGTVDQITKDQMRELGMARTSERYSRPFIIEQVVETTSVDVVMQDTDTPGNALEPMEPHFKGTTLPKRTDFLHQIMQSEQLPLAHTSQQLEPVRICHIDRLPAKFAKFALFIPSITHKIEVLFIAERLARTVLSRVKFSNLAHVLTAISASSAHEENDYQRYEFLGDSLLKLITSIHLVVNNPLWHEGLLSAAKDTIVSNGRLYRTALDLGLDRFILTKSFTGRKWRPSYVSQFETVSEEKRELSTKTLADVVEALLGAAFLDGGYEKLESCAKIFLPERTWSSISDDVRTLYEVALDSDQAASHPKLGQMEEMLGYKFNKPSILFEALTHPCSNDGAPTYQRLEFLGDSLLDHFVVQEFFNHPENLSHQDMHLMRTAVVNAHFLGFLCQSLYITEERSEPASPGKAHISTISTEHKMYLWQLMRHGASWEIMTAQQETKTRYEAWGPAVHDALSRSDKYPWAGLFRINASKFFSDMIESILGAIFVDSRGSLDASRQFLERIGLLPCLRRIIREKVVILHPLNQLHEAAKSDKVQISSSVEKRSAALTPGLEEEEEQEGGGLVFMCTVRVAGEEIVRVEDGVNKLEAEARAAGMAAEILRARMASP